MSDPVGDRLRSYYQSIQGDAPVGLEARVVRGIQSAPVARPVHASWRPLAGLAGLAGVGAAVLVVALVVRGLGPGPVPLASQSAVTGPSAAASAAVSALPDASQSESPTPQATPTAIPNPTGVGESPSPSPGLSPTPVPAPTAHSAGSLLRLGAMTPDLTGPAINLNDSTVLIAGGMATQSNGVKVKSNLAELYQMGSHTFRATGSMADARFGHTLTMLQGGQVLVVGGADMMDGIDNLATAEIYDQTTGKFTRTGSMAQGRADHTATLLPGGKVLIAGGYGGGTLPLATAEIYDPDTGQFTPTGSMTIPRMNHTATLVGGSVLITGGESTAGVTSSAEMYDPDSGTFRAIASMTTAREWHTATPLAGGKVLIAGGAGADQATALASAEIYDPSTGKFTATGSMKTARDGHTATLLSDGQVVVAGGQGTNSLEVYWPDTGKFGNAQQVLGPVSAAASMSDRVLFTGSPPELYCSWPASQGPCG
jgi:hypothetical protein